MNVLTRFVYFDMNFSYMNAWLTFEFFPRVNFTFLLHLLLFVLLFCYMFEGSFSHVSNSFSHVYLPHCLAIHGVNINWFIFTRSHFMRLFSRQFWEIDFLCFHMCMVGAFVFPCVVLSNDSFDTPHPPSPKLLEIQQRWVSRQGIQIFIVFFFYWHSCTIFRSAFSLTEV